MQSTVRAPDRICRGRLLVWVCILAVAMPLAVRWGIPAGPTEPTTDLFQGRSLHRMQIELSSDAQTGLRHHPRKFAPARLRVDGGDWQSGSVRLKGSGTFEPIGGKPNFTLDFAPPHRDGAVSQTRRLYLNNSGDDPSFLREWAGSALFCWAGVPSPRISHTLVELNGRSLGLYVLKEGTEFLNRHFERADGRLYQGSGEEHIPDGTSFNPMLDELAAAAVDPDLGQRWARLSHVLDVERFLSFIVMEVVACHWDGYTLASNNYRVYRDRSQDKLVFVPSGMDQIFANPRLTWHPQMSGLVARALLETRQGKAQYRARLERFVNFQISALNAEIEERTAVLGAHLSSSAAAELREEAACLFRQMAQRQAYLRRELAQLEPDTLALPSTSLVLSHWEPTDAPDKSSMSTENIPAPTLRIRAGPRTSASWRSTVRLPKGRYRFQATGRTCEVAPLPFGRNQGARLRVVGGTASATALLGTQDWSVQEIEFEVREPGPVELVCELRASGGEACWRGMSILSL